MEAGWILSIALFGKITMWYVGRYGYESLWNYLLVAPCFSVKYHQLGLLVCVCVCVCVCVYTYINININININIYIYNF